MESFMIWIVYILFKNEIIDTIKIVYIFQLTIDSMDKRFTENWWTKGESFLSSVGSLVDSYGIPNKT